MPTPLKNTDYLGRCYDIVKVDPLDLAASSQRLGALDVNAQGSAVSTDGRYEIPAIATYMSEPAQNYRDWTVMIFSSSDFQRSVQGAVSVAGSGLGTGGTGSFSGSATYASYSREAKSRTSFTSLMQWVYSAYTLVLSTGFDAAPLDKNFARLLGQLPESDGPAFDAFVAQYGTHFASSVTLGGLAYQQLTFNKSNYQSLMTKQIGLEAGIKGTFRGGVTGEVQASYSKSDSAAIALELGSSTTMWKRRGGNASGDFETWAKSIDDQPAPVSVALEPLTSLMSPLLFSPAKRAALRAAIDRHIAATRQAPFFNAPTVTGLANLQTRGIQSYDAGGFMGTRGQGLRLEAFNLAMFPPAGGSRLRYMAHLAGTGNTGWMLEGQTVGTTGESRQMQGFCIVLDPPSADFDVEYMGHLTNNGDSAWVRNGAWVGGSGYNVEGMEVRVVPKPVAAVG